MKLLVCGSRSWSSKQHGTRIYTVLDALNAEFEELEILQGLAAGADEWALQWATDRGVRSLGFPAEWERHGKRAGILRNLHMLDHEPDLVIAFWDGRSRGTKHTINEASKRGIPTRIVSQ